MVIILYEIEENKQERAVLVGIDRYFLQDEFPVHQSLDELERLVETAGAVVIERIIQKREKPHPATFVGTGMAEEIARQAEDLSADLVIFDDELSGVQMKNLEKFIKQPIIDRTTLILDIFAQRAQTREGKLQVELAQLQYQLSHLIGTGQTFSRQGGGIGTRGPGETKLELSRRRIRDRMTEIKANLETVSNHRVLQREGRGTRVPVVAILGYTNAGKSTLQYELVKQYGIQTDRHKGERQGEDKLFATIDPILRRIELPGGYPISISDTVGFIQKIPHQLISAFQATLEEVKTADAILHVVDTGYPDFEGQIAVVESVITKLGMNDKPQILVLNKIDCYQGTLPIVISSKYPSVEVIARTGYGFEKLLSLMLQNFMPGRHRIRLGIPYDHSKWLAKIYEDGHVFQLEYKDEYIFVDAELDDILYGKLKMYQIK